MGIFQEKAIISDWRGQEDFMKEMEGFGMGGFGQTERGG